MAIIPGLPGPPYLYDDPRFVYDELCLLYDAGGFDEVCAIDNGLIGRKKPGGRSGGRPAPPPVRRKPKELEKDCREILDLVIQATLCSVNDEEVDEESEEKKYHLEYDPIKVSVERIRHEEGEYDVSTVAVDSTTTKPIVCADDQVIINPVQTRVSSSIEEKIRKPKILIKGEVVTRKKSKK